MITAGLESLARSLSCHLLKARMRDESVLCDLVSDLAEAVAANSDRSNSRDSAMSEQGMKRIEEYHRFLSENAYILSSQYLPASF